MLDCNEFVNADEIARGLSPFQPENVAFQAGRIMLERIDHLLTNEVSFAFETTLSTISYLKTIEAARKKNYSIKLIYIWLKNVELARERVKIRVQDGGHNIPDDVIERRYKRGVHNLIKKFIPVCDYWLVADNSYNPLTFVAEGFGTSQPKILDEMVWQIINQQANETREI